MPTGPLKINTARSTRQSRSLAIKNSEPNAATEATVETPAIAAEAEYSIYDSDLSDLTPLSSPIESTLPFKEDSKANGKDGEDSSPKPSTTLTSSSAKSSRHPRLPKETEVGSQIWVLLDRDARVLEPKDAHNKAARKKDWVWWPAKVKERTTRCIKAQIYGTPAPGKQVVEIRTPGDHNILPLYDSKSRLRYMVPTYVDPVPRNLDPSNSPRKRQKIDRTALEKRWRQGLDELRKDQRVSTLVDDSDDEMPAVGSLGFDMLTASLSSIPEEGPTQEDTHRNKRKRSVGLTSSLDEGEPSWEPPLADDMLQIPGEGVLAADRELKPIFWPARILDYVPPQRPSEQPKYLVEYLDTTKKEIPRDWFFYREQPEFATCKLGKWESLLQEIENDEEADKLDRFTRRSPSPEPLDPPPASMAFVTDLSTREQLSYTKPVLQAILNASYGPALERHNMYLTGGQSRKAVVDEASLRGTMDPKDVTKLQEHLREWCLREERSAVQVETDILDESANDPNADKTADKEGEDPAINQDQSAENGLGICPSSPADSDFSTADLPPTSSFTPSEHGNKSFSEKEVDERSVLIPPRQQGCEAYEALSTVEKLDYCLNVLLPEAILQILLWRGGHRRSISLLTDEEEAKLHEKGLELLRERDWVRDVVRFRELKEGKKGGKPGEVYSATGRLKRNVAAPGSYAEAP